MNVAHNDLIISCLHAALKCWILQSIVLSLNGHNLNIRLFKASLYICLYTTSCVYEFWARNLFLLSCHRSLSTTEFLYHRLNTTLCIYNNVDIHCVQTSGACICVRNSYTLVIANQVRLIRRVSIASTDEFM